MTDARVRSYVAALDHNNPFIAAKAAAALGDLGDRSAVGPLIAALGHAVEAVRLAAVVSLGKLGDSSAIGPLRALARRDDREGAFWTVVEALARLGDEQARAIIIDALLHGDDQARERAIALVGSIGDERLLDPLVRITEDLDGQTTRVIANAFSAVRPKADGKHA